MDGKLHGYNNLSDDVVFTCLVEVATQKETKGAFGDYE